MTVYRELRNAILLAVLVFGAAAIFRYLTGLTP